MPELAPRRAEVEGKLACLRDCMRKRRLELVVLTETPNVAWLTAGANANVLLNSDRSGVSVAVTMDQATILANTIEAPRLEAEEHIRALGLEVESPPWWETGEALSRLARSGPKPAASDGGRLGPEFSDIGPDLQELRATLVPGEIDRLRAAADCVAHAMRETIADLTPGMTEVAISAELAKHTIGGGGQVGVILVASDQRISQFRHPLPTEKRVQRYVMLVLSASVGGLHAAVTRLVYFGTLPPDLDAKARAVAEIDARLILTTQAGRTLGDQFSCAEEAYSEAGYPTAIQEHHQGGRIGYLSREVLARPGDPTQIEVDQAFAWNPSLAGVKSEDTILLTSSGPEVLTSWPEWPSTPFSFAGRSVSRPAILER